MPCFASALEAPVTEGPEIRIGSEQDFKPYTFIDEYGRPTGFGVDLIQAVANAMRLRITIRPSTWAVAWSDLVSGRLDALPVVAKLPSRVTQVDFSLPHTETFDAFFVRQGEPFLNNINAAEGKEIVVLRYDAAHHTLLERKFRGRIIPVDTTEEMFTLIASGKHHALLCPRIIGALESDRLKLRQKVTAGPLIPDYKRAFSFAVRKGNPELLEKLNEGLLIVKASGEYDRIYEKWFSIDDPWIRYRKYLALAGFIMAGITLLIGIWSFALRTQVRRRTSELAEMNEKLHRAGETLEERIAERVVELTKANSALQNEISERMRTERMLRESRENLDRAQEVGSIGWWRLDVRKNVLTWSDENHRIFGIAKGTPLTYETFLSAVHPDDREYVDRKWKAGLRGEPYDIEHRLMTDQGTKWVREKAYLEFDAGGLLTGGFGITQDITKRIEAEESLRRLNEELEDRIRAKTEDLQQTADRLQSEVIERRAAEEQAHRLNRLYSVRSGVNEAIIHATEICELYQMVCRIAVEKGQFKMAWVGMTDPETRKVIPVAQWGDSGGYLKQISIIAADLPEGKSPTGRAIYELRSAVCEDIAEDPLMLPWCDKALHHGFRSSAAFPLRSGSVLVGAFTVYSEKIEFFSDEEVYLLESLAADISHASDAIHAEKKRLDAERELRFHTREIENLYNQAPCGYHSLDKDGLIVRINDTQLRWLGMSREEVVGRRKITDFLTAAGREKFSRNFPAFLISGHVSDLEFDLLGRDGSVKPVSVSATALYDSNGEFIMSNTSVFDMSDRKAREEHITAINDLLKLFSGTSSSQNYLDELVLRLSGWSGCSSVAVRLLDKSGNLDYRSTTGLSQEFIECENQLNICNIECVCHRVIGNSLASSETACRTEQGSFFCNNFTKAVACVEGEKNISYRATCLLHHYLSIGIIPLHYKESVLGVIHLADAREAIFTESRIALLESMALLIGEALQKFKIEEELAASNLRLNNLTEHLLIAREEERIKVGREVHDELGQILTAANMSLARLTREYSDNDPLVKKVQDIAELIDVAIEDVQNICSELRPRMLDHLGLLSAIQWETARFSERSQIRYRLDLPVEEISLPPEATTGLFRIFQETLTNVARHSNADQVSVSLKVNDGIHLAVEDNGKGISEEEVSNPESYGILGIRERVRLLGGSYDIRGKAGRGTTVLVTIPHITKEESDVKSFDC